MDLTLNDDDALTLQGLLHDYLPGLRWEAARSDSNPVRHLLVKRQTLCERLLDELGRQPESRQLPKPGTR
jgi:hypothetical protein